MHDLTHTRYYHSEVLRTVTKEDMKDPDMRRRVVEGVKPLLSKHPGFEICASYEGAEIVDHTLEEYGKNGSEGEGKAVSLQTLEVELTYADFHWQLITLDTRKKKYWTHFYHYPSHHPLPPNAEERALDILQLAAECMFYPLNQ